MSTGTALNRALTEQARDARRRNDRARNLIQKRDRQIADLTVQATIYRTALDEIAKHDRDARETGLPVSRLITAQTAVQTAVEALRAGQMQNNEEGR